MSDGLSDDVSDWGSDFDDDVDEESVSSLLLIYLVNQAICVLRNHMQISKCTSIQFDASFGAKHSVISCGIILHKYIWRTNLLVCAICGHACIELIEYWIKQSHSRVHPSISRIQVVIVTCIKSKSIIQHPV